MDGERMIGTEDDRIAAVERECDSLVRPLTLDPHLDGSERRRFDLDVEFLDRGNEDVAAIPLATEDRGEQADHRRPLNRRSLVIPGSVTGDPHMRIPASFRVPLLDRREATFVDQLLDL